MAGQILSSFARIINFTAEWNGAQWSMVKCGDCKDEMSVETEKA